MRTAFGLAVWLAATSLVATIAVAQTPTPVPDTSAVVTPPLSAPPPLAAPQASAAEIEFWNTVKDARNPAEFKAYLETYPNGTFAALAKVRIRALEEGAVAKKSADDAKAASVAKAAADASAAAAAASAAAKAAADARATSASVLTSAGTIREVQAKLYNLNYTVGAQNGALTNETRDAIRQWQSNIKKPVTGDMTQAELDLLRSAVTPTTWGAIAYNARGGSSSVWLRASRQDAETATLTGCRKLNGGNCSSVTAVAQGCIAIGFAAGTTGGTQYTGAYASVRPTQAQAIDNALTECRRLSKVSNNCGIRTTICADGGHKK